MDLFNQENDAPKDKGASKKVSTGLGDVIENVTDSLGIKKCEPCEERKTKLNTWFPFTRKAKKPTSEDIAFFNKVIRNRRLDKDEKKEFVIRYKRIMRKTFTPCDCPSKWANAIDDIKTVVEYFKQIENE